MRGNGGIVVQVRVTVQAGRRLPSILSVPTKRDLTPQGCELDHPASYNQLGYAHRFLENFSAAETPFTKYIELIPNDPNPHDSYAELLMKMGRFDDSIKEYERALSLDPNFVASYVGIGNAHLHAGRIERAREAFAKIASVPILYLTALAWKEAGDARKAAAFAEKAAKFTGLAFSSAYVSRRMKEEG